MKMDIQQLLEQAPFYVAGTIEPDMKTIFEQELAKSPELQERVKFLQITKHAIKAEIQYDKKGHLTYDDIIDYARGAIERNSLKSRSIENHLEICTNCLNEVKIIHNIAKPEPHPVRKIIKEIQEILEKIPERILPLFQSPKLVYITAGLTIVLVIILSIPPKKLVDQDIGMRYRSELRGFMDTTPSDTDVIKEPNKPRPPSYIIKTNINALVLNISIPTPSFDSFYYTGLLESPKSINFILNDSIMPFKILKDSVHVKITIDRLPYFRYEGLYNLHLTEKSGPKEAKTFTYPFYIKYELLNKE
jgi:hypothetical protein